MKTVAYAATNDVGQLLKPHRADEKSDEAADAFQQLLGKAGKPEHPGNRPENFPHRKKVDPHPELGNDVPKVDVDASDVEHPDVEDADSGSEDQHIVTAADAPGNALDVLAALIELGIPKQGAGQQPAIAKGPEHRATPVVTKTDMDDEGPEMQIDIAVDETAAPPAKDTWIPPRGADSSAGMASPEEPTTMRVVPGREIAAAATDRAEPHTGKSDRDDIAATRGENSPAVRVDVVSRQNFPAPAMPAATVTATMLGTSIAHNLSDIQGSAVAPATQLQGASPLPSAHVLKIELHPAELGTVTASLRFAGEQLSIEIQVENHEAHRRLSSDSDEIVKSLQKLGYAVDSVTVLQPQTAPTPTARTDAGAAPGGRDQSQAFAAGQGNGGGGTGGQRAGREHSHDGPASQAAPPRRGDDAGRGLVI